METVNPFFADSRPLICAVFPLAFGFYKAIIAPIAKPGFSVWIMRQIGTECQCASIGSFIVKKLSWERHRGFQRMLFQYPALEFYSSTPLIKGATHLYN